MKGDCQHCGVHLAEVGDYEERTLRPYCPYCREPILGYLTHRAGGTPHKPIPLRFERYDDTVTARGAWFPSGDVIVQWRREAFPEDDQTEDTVTSKYGSIEDADQAAGDDARVKIEA